MPYIIQGNVIIDDGTTLAIEPGVVVKFDSSGKLTVQGTLDAHRENTTTRTIYFTSIKDDDADGRDTNNDGASSGVAGNWDIIVIDSNANGTISYAVIKYGGATTGYARSNLYVSGGTLDADHAEIAYENLTDWMFPLEREHKSVIHSQ